MKKLTSEIANKIMQADLIRDPIDHLVIDDFFHIDIANELATEFGDYEDDKWHKYSNSIEDKRTCNQWNFFKKQTYSYFQTLCSDQVNQAISKKFNIETAADYGLHGGGQHIHSMNGNLNPHLDYSIHPKIKMERRINAIFYLTDDYSADEGGHFGLWGNSSPTEPGPLVKEYAPNFNRIVIFNTSQNSWHGLSRKYMPKETKYRKSLATYYVSEVRDSALKHTRALFAPREDQIKDLSVLEQIKKRVSELDHTNTYVVKK